MSVTNSNCWVSFWENDNYGSGGTHTFNFQASAAGQPMYVYDLSEYYWDGYDHKSKNEMDDAINSLKTGPSTWLYVFSQHNCSGDILKIGPNSAIPDLDELHPPDGGNWQNTIVSFVMYDYCPPCWETDAPTQTGTCWVKLYANLRYTDTCFALYGAGPVVNNGCIDDYRSWETVYSGQYPTTTYVYQYPRSVTTGPQTWVKLYGDTNYGSLIAQLGPNSLVPDLSEYSNEGVMSMEIFSAEPANFYATAQTPNMVLTMEHYQTAAKLGDVLAGAVASIPYVGSMFSGLLTALWPTGPSTTEVWNDMVGYMHAMVQGLIDQNNVKALNAKLSGYGSNIQQYSLKAPGPTKANLLQTILLDLNGDKDYFLNVNDPQQNLTYLLAFGSISVVMLAERAYNYAILSTPAGEQPQTDPDAAQSLKNLQDAIGQLTAAVQQAVPNAVTWRVQQITVQQASGLGTNYELRDAYSGYNKEYSSQPDAQSAQQQLQDYVQAQYQAQLQAYASPADYWPYLYPANASVVADSGNPNFPTTAFAQLPTARQVSVSVKTISGSTGGTTFTDNLNTSRITGVKLYASASNNTGYLTGIQFMFSGQGSGLHGNTGSANLSVTLDSDENIVAIYGGAGSYIDQLFFRTDKGRDFGLGGKGGTDYMGTAPQGAAPALLTLTGSFSSYLYTFALNWQYQTTAAYQGATVLSQEQRHLVAAEVS